MIQDFHDILNNLHKHNSKIYITQINRSQQSHFMSPYADEKEVTQVVDEALDCCRITEFFYIQNLDISHTYLPKEEHL